MNRKPLAVVAAIIVRDGRFLLCRRPLSKARGGQWEFPGGKVEAGETKFEAIVRELREELNITVEPQAECASALYDYPELTVSLTLISAKIAEGEPELLEHLDAKWVTAQEAGAMVLCPADRILLRQVERMEINGV